METQRYKEIVSALFGMTKMINAGLPQPELLRYIAEKTTELLHADSCSIFLIEEGGVLLAHGSFGLSAQEEAGVVFARGEGVAGWVAQHGISALIDDVAEDERYVHLPQQNIEIKSLLCIPLSVRTEVLGVMTVTANQAAAFAREDEELLTFLGNSIVRDLENHRLYQLAITDALTKAYNRQYLFHRLPDEIERWKRYGDALSVVLLDVDLFKRINDKLGHGAGDSVLRELSRLIHDSQRETDALVRYGGEEFLLVLPKTDAAGARVIAERLRTAIADHAFPYSNETLHITVSLGVAAYQSGESEQAFIERADRALYKAKQAGRNQVAMD